MDKISNNMGRMLKKGIDGILKENKKLANENITLRLQLGKAFDRLASLAHQVKQLKKEKQDE